MKQIIEKLKEQADDIFVNRLDPEAASWGMQEGVLISANEARQIVEALEGKAQLPSFEQIIDFATWYSGMEREKVERAYDMYLRDVLGFNGAETISKTETVETQTNWISVEDRLPTREEFVDEYEKREAAELPKGYSKKDYLAGFHQCYEWVIRFVNKTKTTPTPPKH